MSSSYVIDATIRDVVVALCKDYFRRASAIENHTAEPRAENEFKYYNYKIYDATAEVVGPRYAEQFIDDIGKKRGYWDSETDILSENAYYYRKRVVIHNIAKKLHLI